MLEHLFGQITGESDAMPALSEYLSKSQQHRPIRTNYGLIGRDACLVRMLMALRALPCGAGMVHEP